MTSYQLDLLPIRSQLLTSATSRGRSTTFWADLNQTYFQTINSQFAQQHISQLRNNYKSFSEKNQQNQELGCRFNDHYSLYDYFSEVLVSGM